ncbi:MAG: NTP transferase domain-containing protein [Bacteroidales bacterium]|nr:NTP transferase domain-containing protein [Bacteroidales bacterium]MBR6160427.1 NTP transferase domain-containing protein [Bacteroidales bacterium]
MKPTLLILAAGMGSRYGGLKQLDPMGPNGETIMDYSVRYAVESGYGGVVFVIRRSMEEDFAKLILPRYADKIPVRYVFQELDMLPAGFSVNPERKKPYGTAHAILVAKDAIREPFTVINADDFYGRDAFQVMADFLTHVPDTKPATYAMVGYRLDKTLSKHGTVSRGVCQTDQDNHLVSIVENHKVGYTDNGIENIEEGLMARYDGSEPVSMNFWGFTPDFFDGLNALFEDFLRKNEQNITAEFPIPDVITHLMATGKAKIKVLHSNAEWFGVTYQEDRAYVVDKLKQLED